MANLQRRVHALAVPFPASGHMLPLLDLAHLLSARYGFAVTIVVTPKNLPHLSPLLARCPTVAPLVLPFPDNTNLPPGAASTTRSSAGPAPGLIPPPRSSLTSSAAGRTASRPSWESPASSSAPPARSASPLATRCGAGCQTYRILTTPTSSSPSPPSQDPPLYPWRHLSAIYRRYEEGDPLSEFIKASFLANIGSWGFVFNTFAEIEKPYLEHLRDDLGHARVWGVGPLAPPGGGGERGGPSLVGAEEVAAWLGNCAEGSVVYVAFGSLAVLSPAQAVALAAGLEQSGARFVWATRGVVPLPEGFEERVAGRGLVIQGWAPQVAILNHPAVGSFVTHCGWNSVLEAVAAGVALLTWPMGADQFSNARLLEEEVGTGVKACKGGDAVPDPDELARVVAESVGEAGRARREKARELARRAAAAVEVGGSSYMELSEVAAAKQIKHSR
uniref:Glycosyltransferase n=1 Tax=Musa acuminata subsp. malaccensis TaxID=214687 RepID=A0A804KJE5_MUSAM